MKLHTFLLLLISVPVTLAQTTATLEGRVTDLNTKDPLAYVNVYVPDTNYGTVTNQTGYFTLKYPTGLNPDSIAFSHIGYKRLQLSLRAIDTKFVSVTLDIQPMELNEVVVTPIAPLDIVYNSINRIPENYNLDAHTVTGFQREHVSESDKIIQLLEATFRTTSIGTPQEPVSTILDARYIEDKEEKAPLWNPSRGGFYTFGWTSVSGIIPPQKNNFLGIEINRKADLDKYYEFNLTETILTGKDELYVITFDQRKDARRALLKGTIFIDTGTGAIVKLIHELSPRGLQHLNPHETYGGQVISTPPKKLEIRRDRCETTYRKFGSKWYLSTMVQDAEFDASLIFFRVVSTQTLQLKFHSERIVTSIDTTRDDVIAMSNISEIGKIPTLQNFIRKNFENYDEGNVDKWSDQNIIRSDTSFASIARQLHANNQAWESSTRLAADQAATRVHFKSKQLTEDLEFLKASLEAIHPGLYWYTEKEKLNQEFSLVKQHLKAGGSEYYFFELLSPLIEKIHCGHTNLMPSLSKARLLDSRSRFPLEIFINGDSAVASRSTNGVEAGSRILAINDHQMSAIIHHIESAISSDGFNQTYKNYRLNKEFERLFRTHFNTSDTFHITIKNPGGPIRNVILPGLHSGHNQSPVSRPASLVIIDTLQTGLLTIPSFAEEGFTGFLEQVFSQLGEGKISNLIIDIRNNEGGRDEDALNLYSYLSRESFKFYKQITVGTADTTVLSRLSLGAIPFNTALPDYKDHIVGNKFLSHSNLGDHAGRPNAFTGDVYVLINGGTFSTASEFASIAHANRRAVFVGTETGGGYYGNCSLGTPTLTLPNSKLRLSIPLGKYELAVPSGVPPGRGLIPDFRITEDLSDPLHKKDKALEYCFELIQRNTN